MGNNSFEFITENISAINDFKSIIESVDIIDAYEQYYGRFYYRIYFKYQLTEACREAFRKFVSKSFEFADKGKPKPELTKEDKLYMWFRKQEEYGVFYLSFGKFYSDDEIIAICRDLKCFMVDKFSSNEKIKINLNTEKILRENILNKRKN